MKRLAQALGVKLQQANLSPVALGQSVKLLIELEGNETTLLKDYLSRRRRALHDVLSSFAPGAATTARSEAATVEGSETDGGGGEVAVEGEVEEGDGLPEAASHVA